MYTCYSLYVTKEYMERWSFRWFRWQGVYTKDEHSMLSLQEGSHETRILLRKKTEVDEDAINVTSKQPFRKDEILSIRKGDKEVKGEFLTLHALVTWIRIEIGLPPINQLGKVSMAKNYSCEVPEEGNINIRPFNGLRNFTCAMSSWSNEEREFPRSFGCREMLSLCLQKSRESNEEFKNRASWKEN